ncbi:MAG TPA: hypothetical protein VFE78_23405 [Gemmataceae bacterium]|nr:hypothetical protein [Gemmataceae bacterium]
MALFRRKPAAKSRRPRPCPRVEALENRLTPSTSALTASNLLDVTSAPIALAAPTAGPQEFMFELDGMVRLSSGGAEQTASFKIEDVVSLNLPPHKREGKVVDKTAPFDELINFAVGDATLSAGVTGDAVVSLKFEGATEVASIQFEDAASLKLEGAGAEGDLMLHGAFHWKGAAGADLPGVAFDDAASLSFGTGGGSGAGKIPGVETALAAKKWQFAGNVASIQIEDVTGLTLEAGGAQDALKRHITPAAPSAGTAGAPGLMLADMESFSINFDRLRMEYKQQEASAGEMTSWKYADALTLMDGPAATATQKQHWQATGDVTGLKSADDVILSPNGPNDLASDTQHIEAVGKGVRLTLDDTVRLKVGGLGLTSHTHQMETGDVVSIELQSLLSKPGPGPDG